MEGWFTFGVFSQHLIFSEYFFVQIDRLSNPDQTDSQVNASFRLAFNLCFVSPSTCFDFGWAQIRVHVFHRLATQCKSTQVDRKSTVYAWNTACIAEYSIQTFSHAESFLEKGVILIFHTFSQKMWLRLVSDAKQVYEWILLICIEFDVIEQA